MQPADLLRRPTRSSGCRWCHCAPLHKEKPCGRVMGKKPQTELFEEFKKNNLDKPASFWNAMRWTDETKAELFGHKKGHQSRQLEMSGRLVVQNTFIQDPGAHLRLQKESYFLQKRRGGSTKYLIYFLLWCSNECMLFSFFWMHFLHHIFHKSIHPSIFYPRLLLHSGLQVFCKSKNLISLLKYYSVQWLCEISK